MKEIRDSFRYGKFDVEMRKIENIQRRLFNNDDRKVDTGMIHKIFTIRDSKAEAYMLPFFAPTKGVAMRQVSSAVNTKEHDLGKFTLDYALFEIGTFCDQSGLLIPEDAPTLVCSMSDLKESE